MKPNGPGHAMTGTLEPALFGVPTIESSHASVMSKKDQELNYIMGAISKMDDSQRNVLVNLLHAKKLPGLDTVDPQQQPPAST